MAKTAAHLTLTCRAEVHPGKLRLGYAVANRRTEDVYVLDFIPCFPLSDLKTKKPVPNFGVAYVRRDGPSAVHVLKGIPPLPPDRLVKGGEEKP